MNKIAICDDHKDFRTAISVLVNHQSDLEIVGSFINCNQLFNEIEKNLPDLIMLDINMPGINGIDGLSLIKKKFSQVKVIMLTVFDDEKSVMETLKRGADGYLLKKSPPEKIIEGIYDVLSEGAAINPSIAKQVLKQLNTSKPVSNTYNLTKREEEILHLLTEGYELKEIAKQLFISWETVRTHVKKIYEKLGVNSKTDAIRKVMNNK